ncbi:MAG TPA: LamG-like jellyroll fold domain-containing protein, partial [Pyrinomonadaceae bacterium]|nr:LamG-like jellyroll fold domain-containing protein [Pyrinomonadaceae bacterium]
MIRTNGGDPMGLRPAIAPLDSAERGADLGRGGREEKAAAGEAPALTRRNSGALEEREETGRRPRAASRRLGAAGAGRHVQAVAAAPRVVGEVLKETPPAVRAVEAGGEGAARGGEFKASASAMPAAIPAAAPSAAENSVKVPGGESAAVAADKGLAVSSESGAPSAEAHASPESGDLKSDPRSSTVEGRAAAAPAAVESGLEPLAASSGPREVSIEMAALTAAASEQPVLPGQPLATTPDSAPFVEAEPAPAGSESAMPEPAVQGAAPAAPPELVAYWRFDAGTGLVAADSSGKNNTGTLHGATWAAGKVGAGAANFNGAGSQVAVDAGAALRNVTNNFTLSFWARPRAAHEIDPEGSNAVHYGTAGQKYAIGAEQGESLYGSADHAGVGVSVGTNGVSVYEHTSNYMPASLVHQAAIDGWTHVTVVYENRVPKLYVNGTHVRTGVAGPKSFLHVVPQGIGGQNYGFFDGEMDEVKIFNGAMTDAQVAALARPPAELVAHWKFDEGHDNTVTDWSGKGNIGTMQGASRRAGKIGPGAVNFDGLNDTVTVAAKPALRDVVNNFTVAFWARPRAAHEIDGEAPSGYAGVSGQKYAIGAEHGGAYSNDFYNSNDHAGAGVSVGTNGVSVY